MTTRHLKRRRWNDSQLIEAVVKAQSIADVLRSLGLVAAGGNYKSIWSSVKRLNLDTTHWLGQRVGLQHGKFHSPKRSYDDILVENSTYTSTFALGKRLVKDGILAKECAICGISAWLGEPLSLHLDHKNGKSRDHRRENLRLLCPNCHSQTPTYCGKNIGKTRLARVA